jgi:hypothetical protein
MSDAERQRRYRDRLAAAYPKPKPAADGEALALARAMARIAELEAHSLALVRRVQDLEREAKPKVEKPTLPPDEERDRRIKALETTVRNLRARIEEDKRFHRLMEKAGVMPPATVRAISKVLHPDQRQHMNRADLDEALDKACSAFNAWKGDADKARRKGG